MERRSWMSFGARRLLAPLMGVGVAVAAMSACESETNGLPEGWVECEMGLLCNAAAGERCPSTPMMKCVRDGWVECGETGLLCNAAAGETCPPNGVASCIVTGGTVCDTYGMDENGQPVLDDQGSKVYTVCGDGTACVQHEAKCAVIQEDGSACGNGVVEGGEECDDGNTMDSDGCSSTCKMETCGDGVVQSQFIVHEYDAEGLMIVRSTGLAMASDDPRTYRIETCDPGAEGVGAENCLDHDVKGVGGKVMIHACQSNLKCGNGIVDPGEVCDHGKGLDAEGNWVGMEGKTGTLECSTDCSSANICGDGILNDEEYLVELGGAVEECDPGSGAAVYNAQYSQVSVEKTCLPTCTVKVCGNGRVESGEECDPGAFGLNTNACNADCTMAVCGDGIINMAAGEECDPGTGSLPGSAEAMEDTRSCTRFCQISFCGDGIVNEQAGEVCEPDIPDVDTAECNSDCTMAACGDGFVNVAAGEECDPGTGVILTEDQGVVYSRAFTPTDECSVYCKLL